MEPDSEELPPPQHYFSDRPRSRSSRHELRFLYRGDLLTFLVDGGIFASHGLDPGTALLIENLEVRPTDQILDLGCGWGAIGIAAAKSAPQGHVLLTDVNRRAVGLARANIARNGIRNADARVGPLYRPLRGDRFDVIATNPPYHVGRATILQILSGAPEYLRPGGRLILVGKGSQGVRFYQEWLADHWSGSVEVLGRRSGYRVLAARRGAASSPESSQNESRLRDIGTL
jgi:16S rRNA (guanine1207-N2)-methyltransferase